MNTAITSRPRPGVAGDVPSRSRPRPGVAGDMPSSFRARPGVAGDVPSLKERILAAAADTPSPTRAQGQRLTALLTVVSIVVAMAIFWLMGGLAHAGERPLVFTVRLADGWALGAS